MFLNTAVWIKVMLAILIAFVVSFALTPVVKILAQKVGAMDVPGEARRVHDHPIPRMGGLAIFLGFLVSMLLFVDITQEVRGILIGSIIIVITGVIDDIVSLRAWTKFLIQILSAVIAVLHGVVINVVSNPNVFSSQEAIVLGWLAIPLTVLWIVGITNSVNLIDGLDGLAVGVSTISCVTILVVALLVSEPNVALIVAALAGACIGFMPYNLNPARIFMGDTGSLLLGYVLATVSVLGLFKFYAIVTFVVPVLALAVPLSDTLFAFCRRILHGQSPFHADRGHFHHKLMDLGLNQKQAVAILYAVSATLGLAAVVLTTKGTIRIALLILALLIATLLTTFVFFRFGVLDNWFHSVIAILIVFVISFLFTTVAANAIAIVGTNPVSGMTLMTLILSSLVLVSVGLSGTTGMTAALVIGGVVCTALSMAGGFITDLKIGYWLGTTPRKQEAWKFLGTFVAAATVAGVMIILNKSYGFVGEGALVAPQANAMAAVIQPLMTGGQTPWMLYFCGAALALVLTSIGVPALAFALGMFIPMELNAPLVVGGLVAWFVSGRSKDEGLNKARFDRGTLIASGFIAGGALMGVVSAVLKFVGVDWFLSGWASSNAAEWTGLAMYLVLIGYFAWHTLRAKKEE